MMSKRDLGKKLHKEQVATAHVFQEFINSFQETAAPTKTFVKSGVLYADKNQLASSETQIYTPTPFIKQSASIKNAVECANITVDIKSTKKNSKEKTKSNLELLKEEIKQRHSERSEREQLKKEILMSGPALSYFDGGDPNSTNLFVSNLNMKVTEIDLMEDFGVFGPLASVKIMWPRGEEKFKHPNTNCGFVAYMSRKDAERALRYMRLRTDMRVGWGKSVEVPLHPVYIPQSLLKLYLPPPLSGLPFNAQTHEEGFDEDLEKILYNSVIKVTIPLNKKVLSLVNRMVEFVVKEGPLFEAMIMNQEISNPDYQFLFDNKSPSHIYYRWKLFSILQGDATKEWSMKSFRMFKGGSIWQPPIAPNYQAGMPDELINNKKDESKLLSEDQCEHLIQLIQNLTLNRNSIAGAMVFCLQHQAAINDSLEIIYESLCRLSTNPPSKIARLYLLYDVLYNCISKNIKIKEIKFEKIFKELHNCLTNIKNDTEKLIFSSKVIRVVKQLQLTGFLTMDLIRMFEDYFCNKNSDPAEENNSSDNEPLDGASLLKSSLKNSSEDCVIPPPQLKIQQEPQIKPEYFVPSKWDSLDPEEIESQSMSSTKLYYMELETELKNKERETEYRRKEESPRRKSKSKKYKSSSEDGRSPDRYSRKRRTKKRRRSRS